ncbi:MAG: tetratricopeptide repeat protein, partial [Pseudomonadota bacterium]
MLSRIYRSSFIILPTGLLLCLALLSGCSDQEQIQLNSEEDHLEAAKTYRDQGQIEGSLRELTKALEINKDNPETLQMIAETLLAAGDPKGAQSVIKQALEGGLKSSEGNFINVRSLQLQQKNEEALAAFESLPDSDKQVTKFQLMNAEILASLREFEKAIALFNKIHESEPNNADILLGLSKLAMAKDNDVELSLDYANKASEVDSENLQLLIWQGRLSMHQEKYEEAQGHFDKALLKI